METAFPWNINLFLLINATASASPLTLMPAKIFAIATPWLTIAILLFFWLRGTPETRRSLMIAGIALVIGLSVNFLIASFVYLPRPFEVGIGLTFLDHTAETSFPSDHATFLWSLSLGLLGNRPLRRLGGFIFSLGLATAWARVYLGVHFPLDMAASFVIASMAAIVANAIADKMDRPLFQPVERLNRAFLKSISIFSGRGGSR